MRRARRRLIGAIALVLVAVIALPMIFDSERKGVDNEISIHIPSQDALPAKPADTGLGKPKVVEPTEPRAAGAERPRPAPVEVPKPPTKAEAPGDMPKAAPAKGDAAQKAAPPAKPEPPAKATPPKPEAKPAPKSEEARAAAILEGRTPEAGGFAVQIGAFATEDKVREARDKLAAAGFKTYTEKLDTKDGERTRVRAGPFPARDAAEAAREKIRALGFDAAVVAR